MISLYRQLAGLGLLVALVLGGWLLWTRRSDELAAAKAQRAQAVQALASVRVNLQTDQHTVSALQQQALEDNTVLAQIGQTQAENASTAATINAQIATSQNGPVAPVLAQTLEYLTKAQGNPP